MSEQPPEDPTPPPADVTPPSSAEPSKGGLGPWIVAAAVVLALGVLLAVLINNNGDQGTKTGVTVSPTINTTTVQRNAPTITTPPAVTQSTTVVVPAKPTVTVSPESVPTTPEPTTTVEN